jgi:hypothetical protein
LSSFALALDPSAAVSWASSSWEAVRVSPSERVRVAPLAAAHGVRVDSGSRFVAVVRDDVSRRALSVSSPYAPAHVALALAGVLLDWRERFASGDRPVFDAVSLADMSAQVAAAPGLRIMQPATVILERELRARIEAGVFASDPLPRSLVEVTLAGLLADHLTALEYGPALTGPALLGVTLVELVDVALALEAPEAAPRVHVPRSSPAPADLQVGLPYC